MVVPVPIPMRAPPTSTPIIKHSSDPNMLLMMMMMMMMNNMKYGDKSSTPSPWPAPSMPSDPWMRDPWPSKPDRGNFDGPWDFGKDDLSKKNMDMMMNMMKNMMYSKTTTTPAPPSSTDCPNCKVLVNINNSNASPRHNQTQSTKYGVKRHVNNGKDVPDTPAPAAPAEPPADKTAFKIKGKPDQGTIDDIQISDQVTDYDYQQQQAPADYRRNFWSGKKDYWSEPILPHEPYNGVNYALDRVKHSNDLGSWPHNPGPIDYERESKFAFHNSPTHRPVDLPPPTYRSRIPMEFSRGPDFEERNEDVPAVANVQETPPGYEKLFSNGGMTEGRSNFGRVEPISRSQEYFQKERLNFQRSDYPLHPSRKQFISYGHAPYNQPPMPALPLREYEKRERVVYRADPPPPPPPPVIHYDPRPAPRPEAPPPPRPPPPPAPQPFPRPPDMFNPPMDPLHGGNSANSVEEFDGHLYQMKRPIEQSEGIEYVQQPAFRYGHPEGIDPRFFDGQNKKEALDASREHPDSGENPNNRFLDSRTHFPSDLQPFSEGPTTTELSLPATTSTPPTFFTEKVQEFSRKSESGQERANRESSSGEINESYDNEKRMDAIRRHYEALAEKRYYKDQTGNRSPESTSVSRASYRETEKRFFNTQSSRLEPGKNEADTFRSDRRADDTDQEYDKVLRAVEGFGQQLKRFSSASKEATQIPSLASKPVRVLHRIVSPKIFDLANNTHIYGEAKSPAFSQRTLFNK